MRVKAILLFTVCMVLASVSQSYAAEKRTVQQDKKYGAWTSLVSSKGSDRTFQALADETNGPSLLVIDFSRGCKMLPAIVADKSRYPAKMSELKGSVRAGRKKPVHTTYRVEYLNKHIVFVAFTGMDYTAFLDYADKGKNLVFTVELPESGKTSYTYPLDGLAEAAENTFKLCREYTAESKKKDAGKGKRTPR